MFTLRRLLTYVKVLLRRNFDVMLITKSHLYQLIKEDCNLKFDWNEDLHHTNWKKLALKSCFCASTFQWACGIELRLRAIDLLSFCRDVIFLTRVGFFSCSIKIRCCLAPSYLKKCLVHLHFRLRAKVITITAKKVDQTAFLKSRCSKQAYTIALESVLTEEEAAEYLEQLAFEEEEEQILRSCFFSGEEDITDCYVSRVMKYKAFTTRIERIKRMIECVYLVSIVLLQNKPLRISA